jgi:hypothetical protein
MYRQSYTVNSNSVFPLPEVGNKAQLIILDRLASPSSLLQIPDQVGYS